MLVILSPEWETKATQGGHARQNFGDEHGLRNYGENQSGPWLRRHIMGCRSECAVAKVLHLPWSAQIGILGGTDVGGKVEVRSRALPGGKDLAMRPHDKLDRPFVLVHIHENGTGAIELIGWLWGQEAMERARSRQNSWCQSKRCWYVPGPYRDINDLIKMFAGACEAAA